MSGMCLLYAGSSGAGAAPAFSPGDISGLAVWLKADAGLITTAAGSTPAVDDGDPVGKWQDQSGNSRHATMATSSKRPTLLNAGANGLPVVVVDGVDDYLAFATDFTLGTAFVVANYTAGAVAASYSGLFCSTSNQSVFRLESGTTRWRSSGGTGDGVLGTTVTIDGVTTTDLVTLSTFKLSSGTISNGATNPITFNGYELGRDSGDSSRCWGGKVCEIIMYDSVLSAGDLTSVRSYLKSRWGTA